MAMTHTLGSVEDACLAVTDVLRCWARVSEFLQCMSIYLEDEDNVDVIDKDDMDVAGDIESDGRKDKAGGMVYGLE